MTAAVAVRVVDAVGPHCLTMDDGQRVFQALQSKLSGGDSVVLDFSGVDVIASPFMNAAVGQLLQAMTTVELRKRITFEHLSEVGRDVLERVVHNSSEYYSNPDARRAVDTILEGVGEE